MKVMVAAYVLFMVNASSVFGKDHATHLIKNLSHTVTVEKNGLWSEEISYVIKPNMLAGDSIKLSLEYHSLLEATAVDTTLPVTLYKTKEVKQHYYVKSLEVTIKPVPIKDFHITFKRQRLATDERNHFSRVFHIEYPLPVTAYQLTLQSQLPLRTYLHDPNMAFKLTEKSPKHIELASTRLISKNMVHGPILNIGKTPAESKLEVSSAQSMSDILAYTAELIEERLQEPLPKSFVSTFASISPSANANENDENKAIMDALAYVQSTLKYTLDWDSIQDVYRIKSLAELEQTNEGSCKEFSLLLIRLLKRLGVEAYFASTARDHDIVYKPNLPTGYYLNHMLVYAKSRDRREFWLDPVDLGSKGIPQQDLHGQRAYIFKNTSPLVLETKSIPPHLKGNF